MSRRATSGGEGTVVLSGPPGSGKSTLSRALARRLEVEAVDLDDEVEREAGRSPAEILRTDGEAALREHEAIVLESLGPRVANRRSVVALGGGTLTTAPGRRGARRLGPVLGLTADVPSLQARLSEAGPDRPLLAHGLDSLLAQRRTSYAAVDEAVDAGGAMDVVADGLADRASALRSFTVTVGPDETRLVFGRNLVQAVAGAVAAVSPSRPVLLLEDEGVPQTLRNARAGRIETLFPVHRVGVCGGERVKTWTFAGEILESALAAGCGRQSVVVGLGGGATCDLAGLVAHLLGRGAPLVLVPTTLLAQADAALGGKCAVNMAAGRNLVGAFHAARELVVDDTFLPSLPPEERRSGLAEVLKAAVVGDAALFDRLETNPIAVGAEEIRRSVAVKARIVAEDPFETGRRKVLNLGHTLGHALETASEHAMRHGEGVAIGICAVARWSADEGWCRPETARRIVAAVEAADLPTRADPDLLRRAAPHIARDKKAHGGSIDQVIVREVADVALHTLSCAHVAERLVRHGGTHEP